MEFFTQEGVAIKSSANRPAGTEILIPVSVTGETWGAMMEEKVFPQIRAKMPDNIKHVKVQLDNAK